MKKIFSFLFIAVMCFSILTGCSIGSKDIEVVNFTWIADTYKDNAIEIDIKVKNIGQDTIESYTIESDLYDSNGKYLTTFTSKSARSISPGETRDGDLHLELNSIDASKVKDVKVSIKNIVRQ